MGRGQPGCALRQLRALFVAGTTTGLADSELLERYTSKRAESAEAAKAAEMAFAALMDRHGAMVWGVCHRVLGDAQEPEDAFLATFLVLHWSSCDPSPVPRRPAASVPFRLPSAILQKES
jgi:hypothetical protein